MLPPAMIGRWLTLRPVHRDDLLTLFAWRVDATEPHIISRSRRLPTYEEFAAEMEQTLHGSIMLLALDPVSDEPVGYTQAHTLNLEAGWCFATVYITSERRRPEVVTEAYSMIIDFAFRRYGLRKVYLELYEFEEKLVRPLLGAGAVEEGRFREHTWFDNRHWDVVRLAIHRERWEEGREQIPFLLGIGEQAGAAVQADGRGMSDDV